MVRKPIRALAALALSLSTACLLPAAADGGADLIDDFSGYADSAALQAVWLGQNNPSVALEDGALSFGYTAWGDVYRSVDFTAMPADAEGIALDIYSEGEASLTLKLGYNAGAEYRYEHAIQLAAGENEIRLPFADGQWTGTAGWGTVGAMLPVTRVQQLMISTGGGENTVLIDNIRFLKGSETGELPPADQPEEPELPTDPYVLEDFEGYANSASLGYGGLWTNNSGGGCLATLSLETGGGNIHAGTSLKIDATDTGWMTVTRSGVTVPPDAASMTFWARAEAETTLNLEFRLNNNAYKYAPSKGVAIGTEGAFYTVYFADCRYVQGSGDADMGWSLDDRCLVNGINFLRDGYDAVTLYLDDISFGTQAMPEDPNDPIALLEKAIDELPDYKELTVLDVQSIQAVYADYAALSAAEKRQVSNRQERLDAKELADLWADVLGGRLDDAVSLGKGIAALPESVGETERPAVDSLWKAYEALTEEQRALVPGAERLEAAYQSLYGGGSSPDTGAALPAGTALLGLAAAGAAWVSRKKR